MGGDGLGRWWGPVFEAERVAAARRWQGYGLRSFLVLALLAGLVLLDQNAAWMHGPVTIRGMAQVGKSVYQMLVVVEVLAALLIAPATTAGATCLDKSRGTLAHVFVTDLTDREIVLGKLAARLVPVWGLLACAFPVAALATMLGGIDPAALARALLLALALSYLGAAFALMLSVWAARPHEVIAVVYAAWAAWLLDWPAWEIVSGPRRAPAWIEWTHPFFLLLGQYTYPHKSFTVPTILFALACAGAGTACLVVAVRKVRVVGCRSPRPRAPRAPGRLRRALAGGAARLPRWPTPDLDADPVLWREWHRARPSTWSRRVWLGYRAVAAVVGIAFIASARAGGASGRSNDRAGVLMAALTIFGFLLIGAATPSVLAEERARGSLDVLMTTPISTRAILLAKWRGAFRPVPGLVGWPLAVGLTLVLANGGWPVALALVLAVAGLILAQGAALVSLGLALATGLRRTGHATAWTLAAVAATVVGWLILGGSVNLHRAFGGPGNRAAMGYVVREYLLPMGSPFFNVGLATAAAASPANTSLARECPGILVVALFWAATYALAAWGLFELTVATFDRCLGRAPERPRPVPTARAMAREEPQRLGLENS